MDAPVQDVILAVPEDSEGADTLVRYTLDRLYKIRADSVEHLEWCEEQLRIAKMLHHEAVKSVTALEQLTDGEMYFESLDSELDAEAWTPSDADLELADTEQPEPEAPAESAPPPGLEKALPAAIVKWRQKTPADPSMSTDEIEARNQAVLAALPGLWAKGGRILARDVWEVTGDTQAVVYRALKVLQERGALRLVKEQTHPGTNATCNSILPPLGEVAELAPKAKREDRSVMAVLERLWAAGDVTLHALATELHILGRDYSPKVLLTDCTNLANAGWMRIRDLGGVVYILPKEGEPVPPGSQFDAEGLPLGGAPRLVGFISPRKLERAKKLIADGLNLRTVHAMIDVDLHDLEAALQ